ncbi:MAG: hypothetical protein Q8P02_01300 [Candidatus Micrarchaeota archaeon]|nr:hypothetical protein [Candidatus Micrarchaeota archaeon]
MKKKHPVCQYLEGAEKTLAKWEDKSGEWYNSNPGHADLAFRELLAIGRQVQAATDLERKKNPSLASKADDLLRRVNVTRALAAECGTPPSDTDVKRYIGKIMGKK